MSPGTTLERAVALEHKAAQRIGEAATSGGLMLLNKLLNEMTLPVEQLDQMRKRIGDRPRLIARFSVEVPQERVVSLIIPSGVFPYQGARSLEPQGLSGLDFHSSQNESRIMMPGWGPNR